MHSGSNWRPMRYIPLPGFVCKSFCRPLSHKVSLSWLPCSAAEKQMGERRRERAGWGGGGTRMRCSLTLPPSQNHQSDLISWLAEWVAGLVRIRPALTSCSLCFSINHGLHNATVVIQHRITITANWWRLMSQHHNKSSSRLRTPDPSLQHGDQTQTPLSEHIILNLYI